MVERPKRRTILNKIPKAKMPFWELAHGKLAADVQSLFERAQKTVIARNLPCKVKLVIEIKPPDPTDPYYGNIRYQTDISEPPQISKQYQTILHDGMIIRNPEMHGPQLDLLFQQTQEEVDEQTGAVTETEFQEEGENLD